MSGGDELSDAVLVERALAGDDRAFATIVSRNKTPLYRFISRYVGNDDKAYDVLQQVFVSAWQSLARFDRGRPLRPWLNRIALNKCRDHARRMRVRRLFFGVPSILDIIEVPDLALNAEDKLLRDERQRALATAIIDLPRQLKEPLLLTVFAGLTQADAGRQLGISVKAVETRIARARRRLGENLGLLFDGSTGDEI